MVLAKTLDGATKRIKEYSVGIERNFMKIALELNNVNETEVFKRDYNTISEYAQTEFGFKKSMTYNLIKMANKYIDEATLQSTLPHGDKDFTVGQLTALLPIETEEAETLITDGIISEDTSVREIKTIVKSLKNRNNELSENVEDSETDELEENDNQPAEIDEFKEQYFTECADVFYELERAIARLEAIALNDDYKRFIGEHYKRECKEFSARIKALI